jgi:hypothetical protein
LKDWQPQEYLLHSISERTFHSTFCPKGYTAGGFHHNWQFCQRDAVLFREEIDDQKRRDSFARSQKSGLQPSSQGQRYKLQLTLGQEVGVLGFPEERFTVVCVCKDKVNMWGVVLLLNAEAEAIKKQITSCFVPWAEIVFSFAPPEKEEDIETYEFSDAHMLQVVSAWSNAFCDQMSEVFKRHRLQQAFTKSVITFWTLLPEGRSGGTDGAPYFLEPSIRDRACNVFEDPRFDWGGLSPWWPPKLTQKKKMGGGAQGGKMGGAQGGKMGGAQGGKKQKAAPAAASAPPPKQPTRPPQSPPRQKRKLQPQVKPPLKQPKRTTTAETPRETKATTAETPRETSRARKVKVEKEQEAADKAQTTKEDELKKLQVTLKSF